MHDKHGCRLRCLLKHGSQIVQDQEPVKKMARAGSTTVHCRSNKGAEQFLLRLDNYCIFSGQVTGRQHRFSCWFSFFFKAFFFFFFFRNFAITAPLSGHFSSLQLFNRAENSYCCMSRSSCRRECRRIGNVSFLSSSSAWKLSLKDAALVVSLLLSYAFFFFFASGSKILKIYAAVSLPQCHHACVPALLVWQLADNYDHPPKKTNKNKTHKTK